MTLYEMMGWISTTAVLLPVALILSYKLTLYRSFPALLAYFGILFICNLFLLNVVGGNIPWHDIQDALQNILAGPLSLVFLTYFARSVEVRRRMMIASGVLVAYEIVVLCIKGFSDEAFRLLTAPGLALAFAFGFYFFLHQVKLTITYQKALGKALIVSAMLFATIGSSYIYIVRYYINPQYRQDADLIQFVLGIFIAVAVSIGLILERKRIQELEELRIAREELKEIYGDEAEKTTGPFGTVAFHLDNESWS